MYVSSPLYWTYYTTLYSRLNVGEYKKEHGTSLGTKIETNFQSYSFSSREEEKKKIRGRKKRDMAEMKW